MLAVKVECDVERGMGVHPMRWCLDVDVLNARYIGQRSSLYRVRLGVVLANGAFWFVAIEHTYRILEQ